MPQLLVMQSKILKHGFTLVEIIVSMGIVVLISTLIIVYMDPTNTRARFRDNKRISDLSVLDRCIAEYYQDHETFPDSINILRTSNTLPAASTKLSNANMGWIAGDISAYNSKMPIDPLNDNTYKYYYIQNGIAYEIDAVLETDTTDMQNDGGNDPLRYEVGTNLNLISPN